MLNQAKIAQMAAYLLQRQGGTMYLLKLTKLLYLCEREAVARFGTLISGDMPVSMPQGPVLSQTLDLMNGASPPVPGGWDSWISDREGYSVSLNPEVEGFNRSHLDALSDAEINVLDRVWQQFGQMDRWEIRDWTHNNCAEWQDPNGSSLPIQMMQFFQAVGFSNEQSRLLNLEANAEDCLDKTFASL